MSGSEYRWVFLHFSITFAYSVIPLSDRRFGGDLGCGTAALGNLGELYGCPEQLHSATELRILLGESGF